MVNGWAWDFGRLGVTVGHSRSLNYLFQFQTSSTFSQHSSKKQSSSSHSLENPNFSNYFVFEFHKLEQVLVIR